MINITLIGFMGSGKTTIGRILAERLNYSLVDTDRLIEEKTGATIPDLFKSRGEAGFREIESEVLEEVLKSRGLVISCGGGVVLLERNRAMLKESSAVVYLRTEPAEIFDRVGNTGDQRPLLDVEDPKSEIRRLLDEREPLYQEVAEIVIDTTGKRAYEVVELIVRELKIREGYLD